MTMLREGGVKAARGTFVERFRVQALLMVMIAMLLPAAVVFYGIELEHYTQGGILNSVAAAATGVMVGMILLRRVTAFPGVGAFGFIFPSFAASYGLVLVALFAIRYEYSRLYLGSSFALALVCAFFLSYWVERYGRRRFYLVPYGNIEAMHQIEGAEWCMMTAPTIPTDRNAVIVADLRHDHEPAWERMLAEAAVNGHPVYHTKQLGESLTGRVAIEHLSENSFGSLMPNLAYVKVKRVVDVVACIVLIPLLLVPLLILALVIRLDSRGPVFFFQERMGHRGKPFLMYKFRTMQPRPPSEDGEAARADAMTQAEDNRITRIGRFLRRMRLDELPQILNVLRGEMSIIGPRPEAVPLSRWYEAELPFYSYRHIVRPGITGWAQVHQGHVTDLEAVHMKLHYDFYYIKNFSAWLDILISFRTVATIMSGFGSK